MLSEPDLRAPSLRDLLAPQLDAGDLRHFEPYERVHRENVKTVLEALDPA
jgi:hypothetical protein